MLLFGYLFPNWSFAYILWLPILCLNGFVCVSPTFLFFFCCCCLILICLFCLFSTEKGGMELDTCIGGEVGRI